MKALVQNMVMISVIFLMLGVGLRTSVRQIVDATRQFGLMSRGVLANFLVVPALFYLGVQWSGLAPEVGIGIMIMAAAPVAPMAPPFVGMARGDLPYAVGLMTIAALLCVPLTPLILSLCLSGGGQGLDLDTWKIIQTVLTAQLIPISVGVAIHHASPAWTEKLLKVVPRLGQGGLAISIILIVIVGAKQLVGIGPVAHLAIFLAVIASLLIGDWMMLGESASRRSSLGISTAVRNPALALLIATTNFAGTDAIPAVLVFAIYSMLVAIAYAKLKPVPG
jgi:BASS family bile acid:Na+ symporter